LISDANILLDLAPVDGLGYLVQLGTLEVLDVVLTEVQSDPRVPNLAALGIRIVPVEPAWLLPAQTLKQGGLSLPDAFCLHYASTGNHILLSNDKPLRKACHTAQVEVHGSLWIVLELHRQNLAAKDVLCDWLEQWTTVLKARLPTQELALVRQTLGC
jgi:hypothetical protein